MKGILSIQFLCVCLVIHSCCFSHYNVAVCFSVIISCFLTFQVQVCSNPVILNHTHYALEVAKNVIMFYEQEFGVPYPLPKQGELEPVIKNHFHQSMATETESVCVG